MSDLIILIDELLDKDQPASFRYELLKMRAEIEKEMMTTQKINQAIGYQIEEKIT